MSAVEQTVDSWGVKITENENDIASLKLTDEQFEVKMSQNITRIKKRINTIFCLFFFCD